MRDPLHAQIELRRCWRLACEVAGLDRHGPHVLPLLFAIDVEPGFPDGHYYRIGAGSDGDVAVDVHEIGCAADCGSDSGDPGGGCGGCGGD